MQVPDLAARTLERAASSRNDYETGTQP
jgi:hypothetical protein